MTAGLYLWGVVRLHRRGDHWPVGRTLSFVGVGMGSATLATVSGLAVYDDTLLSVHMVQHMVLAMVVPLAMALGAPITLALRTLPRRPRRWLLAVLHSRVAKVLTFPPLTFTLFVLTPWALYFSGWYPATLHSDYLHEMTHFHMVLIGCLFFWPLMGIDPIPGRISYPARMLLVVADPAVPRLHGRHDHGPEAAHRRILVPRAARGTDGCLAAHGRMPTRSWPAASSGAPATPSGWCSSRCCSCSGCAPRCARPSARTAASTSSRPGRRGPRGLLPPRRPSYRLRTFRGSPWAPRHLPRTPGSLLPVSDSQAGPVTQQGTLRVLVYSDDVDVRQQVILALGRRPHPDLPELEYVEVATEPVVLQNMDAGGIDLAILDGEAAPAGGMGIAKQLKDEIYRCPPILVLIGRPQDAWLATWSRAEAVVPHPIDPVRLAEAVTALLRPRVPATR